MAHKNDEPTEIPAKQSPRINTTDDTPNVLSPYAKQPSSPSGYVTPLNESEIPAFLQWVHLNNIPFDPSPTADYDMPGFWKALMSGDPKATTGVDPNDRKIHFTDYWKTPYHRTFSRESKYALPDAPRWNDKDQLVDKRGNVLYDDRKKPIWER